MKLRMRTILRFIGVLALLSASLTTSARASGPAVSVPERTRVCMVQDTVMAVPAIPLARDGKTYYGCCQMCKGKIAAEPERYTKARDPMTGAMVDKATAELLSVDGRVLYFESAAARDRFVRTLPGESPSTPAR